MSFDSHLHALSKLCRVCGIRLTKTTSTGDNKRKLLQCNEYRKEIYTVFGVSTWGDRTDEHPTKLCSNCARKLRHYQAGKETYSNNNSSSILWSKHTRTETCKICSDFTKSSKGGRPAKRNCKWLTTVPKEEQELPFKLSEHNIFSSVLPIASTRNNLCEISPTLDILGKDGEDFLYVCAICQCILSYTSVQTPCQHYFCSRCLSDYFKFKRSATVKCPICNATVNFYEVADSPRVLKVQLANLTVVCLKCSKLGKLEKCNEHECNVTKETACTRKHTRVTIVEACPKEDDEILRAAALLRDEALKHKKGEPIPYAIEQATDRWTWMKLQQGEKVASLKTGGKPAIIKQVSNSAPKQHPKPINNKQQQPLVPMPANKSLAMMRDCHLSWDQLRKVRRYVGPSSIASERSMRVKQKDLLKDSLVGRKVPLRFTSTKADSVDGYETRYAPFVVIENLQDMIIDYLDRLERCGTLTWHDGVIPPNEIWVKVGGDKGGSSFKLAFQIVNVARPNSLQNTVTFACFEADDSYSNLQSTLPKVFDQVKDLAKQTWRGRTFRLFCFGDYALLTKLYGINGPNARYCCIYCHVSKKKMQQPLCQRGASETRTLTTINNHYDAFVDDGKQKTRAKDVSYSVVNRPMLHVEVDHVIIPSLHISLGVFKKLFDMFEEHCHRLDVDILNERIEAEDVETTRTHFDCQVASEANRKEQLQKQLEAEQQHLEDLEENMPLNGLCDPKSDVAKNAQEMRHNILEIEQEAATTELNFGTGPIACSIDGVLKSHKIHRQAYHGKSFVGNHVHRFCQPKVIEDVVNKPRLMIETTLEELPIAAHHRLGQKAATFGGIFKDVFLKFADVHYAINHANKLSQVDIEHTDVCIKQFLHTYRELFPDASITPKLHLLEDHAFEQLNKFRVGLGLLNEQGGELLHTEFNRAGRVVQGMQDDLEKLMSVMRRHLTSTFPEVYSEYPRRHSLQNKEP